MVIEPAQNLGGAIDEINIGFGIEMAEDLVSILKYIYMLNIGGESTELNCLCDGIRCMKVACSRASGKYEHTSQHDTPVAK